MRAFYMALFAAVCWGIAPLFGKIGLRGVHPLNGLGARTLVTFFFVWGWILASGGGVKHLGSISLKSWLFLAAEAFFATFAGDLAYYAAIKWGEIGQAGLVLAASPLITLWVGWRFLGESLHPLRIIGAVLIIAGIVLIGYEASH